MILVLIVALEHLYFLWLEMFAWETKGKKVFSDALDEKLFTPTKTLAANQGLYNGFLAAGLIWSVLIPDPNMKLSVSVFFLTCVTIAGIYGSFTISKKIIFVQSVPALIALIIIHF